MILKFYRNNYVNGNYIKLIIILLLFFSTPLLAFTTYVFPQNNYGNTTNNISISINVNIDSIAFRGYKLCFKYDNEIIEFVDANAGDLFDDFDLFWWKTNEDSVNVIRVEYIIFGINKSVKKNGNILNLKFKALKNGTSELKIIDQEFYDSNTGDILDSVKTIDGKIIIDDSKMKNDNNILLHNIYPNPFSNFTNVSISAIEETYCNISIYSINGKKVKTLFNKLIPNNSFINFIWHGTNNNGNLVTSGIYLCVLKNGKNIQTKKVIFCK